MNVAIFTDNDFEKVNGVTTTLKAVLRHRPPGLNLRVYTASRRASLNPQYFALRAPGVPIPFYREMSLYLPNVDAFRREVAATHADVIHLTTPGPIGLAAMRIARQLDLPMVGSFHTDLAAYARLLSGSEQLGSLMRTFLRWPYGRCTRVLAPSEATRQLLMGSGDDHHRIEIWRRGVDSARFSPSHRSGALRRQWQVSGERPAILYVGRVSREKGLHLLPELAAALARAGVAHRFVIVGHGPMQAELQKGLPDAVFTGVLEGHDLAAAYASADAFVFPSRTDTAGNVVLEAQASGLPVLVTNVGGPQENLDPQRSGYVVHDMTAASWMAALVPLLQAPGHREAMAKAARSYAESRTWAVALEPLYRAYEQMASTPAPTRRAREMSGFVSSS